MNPTLHNIDVSSGIVLLNIHTLPKDNESIHLNEMNISVENGGFNSYYCYTNSTTVSEPKNHNYIDYTNKIHEISINIYLMKK